MWNAYRRWAHIQEINIGDGHLELDGWLHRVPALRERSASAPATVAALEAAYETETAPLPRPAEGTTR